MLRFAAAALCISAAAAIWIDSTDGGYRDVLVSISKDVPHNESIVDNIKALFQSSSEFLHRATNGLVYFKHVTIEFPISWPTRDSARTLSSSSFERSNVRITLPTKTYGDNPFTEQPRLCGKPGDFIQLTPGFLAQTQNLTSQGPNKTAYVFVHEWAHFRYGVFDEYGIPGDQRYPLFHCNKSGEPILNACSSNIQVQVKGFCPITSNCVIPNNCVLTISPKASVESSIMFMPYFDKVNQFCDDQNGSRQHNPHAPNKQNAFCGQNSTWEVIRKHDDFLNLAVPNPSKPIQVTFEEAQQKDDIVQRVILVLDVSTSMNINGRLTFLQEAVTRYVEDIEDNSRRLAIVAFSTKATVVHPLDLVNGNTRQGYLNQTRALTWNGFTCIGCGLKSALELLTSPNETAEGGLIVLMSDGEENQNPRIATMLPKVVQAKVVVSTVALGSTADNKLEELAIATHGKAFSFQDLQVNLGLEMERAFVQATTTQDGSTHQSQTLMKAEEVFNGTFEKTFHIDSGVGNNTEVYVYKNHPAAIEAWLVDPHGQRCQDCDIIDGGGNYSRILIPSPAEVGDWTLRLSSNSSDEIGVSLQVRSKARTTSDVEPIRVTCTLGSILVGRPDEAVIYATVKKGSRVLLDAVVYAEVTGPNPPHKSSYRLYDNGEVPDNQADDGTYSGYFSKFTGQGRYAVTAHVKNQNTTRLADPAVGSGSFFTEAIFAPTTSLGTSPHASSEPAMEDDDFIVVDPNGHATHMAPTGIAEAVDPFQRVVSGGSFQVTDDIWEQQVPPRDISDLDVADVQPGPNGTLLVKLTWTWPGAHLNSGNASSVEIRAGKEHRRLKESFESGVEITEGNVVEGDLNPLPPGAKHVVTLSLPAVFASPQGSGVSNWNVYLAARVSNSDGLKSTSNTAYASYIPDLVPTTVTTTTETTTNEARTTMASTTNASPTESATTAGTTIVATTTEVTTVQDTVAGETKTDASPIEATTSNVANTETYAITTPTTGATITEVPATVATTRQATTTADDTIAPNTEKVTKTVTATQTTTIGVTRTETAAITSTPGEATASNEMKIEATTSVGFSTEGTITAAMTTEAARTQTTKTFSTTRTASTRGFTAEEEQTRKLSRDILPMWRWILIAGVLTFFIVISAALIIWQCAKKHSNKDFSIEMGQISQGASP